MVMKVMMKRRIIIILFNSIFFAFALIIHTSPLYQNHPFISTLLIITHKQ